MYPAFTTSYSASKTQVWVVYFKTDFSSGDIDFFNLLCNDRKQTALHKAAWYGRIKMCETLLDAGASFKVQDYKVDAVLFALSLSSYHEKALVALCFGRTRTRLGIPKFRWFQWLLITKFAACSKPPSSDYHRNAPYPRTQQRVRRGWELNLDHGIVITRST